MSRYKNYKSCQVPLVWRYAVAGQGPFHAGGKALDWLATAHMPSASVQDDIACYRPLMGPTRI